MGALLNRPLCALQWEADCYGCPENLRAASMWTDQSRTAGQCRSTMCFKIYGDRLLLELQERGLCSSTTVSFIAEFIFIASLSTICAHGQQCISEELEALFEDLIKEPGKSNPSFTRREYKTVTMVFCHAFRFWFSFSFTFILIQCQIQ